MKFFPKWLFAWLIISAYPGLGQSRDGSTADRQQKVRALNRLAEQSKGQSPQQSLAFAQQALELARQLGNQLDIALSLNHIGEFHLDDGNYPKALELFNQALTISQAIHDKKSIALALNKIGVVYYFTNRYTEALKYQFLALDTYRDMQLPGEEAKVLNAISYVYGKQGMYQKSLEYQLRALNIRRRLKDRNEIAKSLISIGDFYLQQEDLSHALESYQESYRISLEANSKKGVAISLDNMGVVLGKQGRYQEAFNELNKALSLKREIGNKKEMALSLSHLGLICYEMGRYEDALGYSLEARRIDEEIRNKNDLTTILNNIGKIYAARKDYTNSLYYHQQALTLASELKALPLLKESYEYVADTYLKKADAVHFMKYYQLYATVRDSLSNSIHSVRIGEIQEQYENEKRQREIARVELEKKVQDLELARRQTANNFLKVVAGLLLAVALLAFLLYRIKSRLSRQLQQQNEIISQQNQKLTELNETKDKFFSIISHDLRGPIGTLSSFLTLLIRYGDNLTKQDIVKMAVDVEKRVKNVSALLEDLLKWAKTQMQMAPFEPQKIELSPLFNKNIDLLTAEAGSKTVTLLGEIDSPLCVMGDYYMLDLVLRNLLSNAIKFTQAGGQVKVRAIQEANEVEISVVDTGIGMTKEQVQHLFDVGKKRSSLGTANELGSGLGLLLCKEFIEQHGSTLQVSSRQEVGSTFTFRLPVCQA